MEDHLELTLTGTQLSHVLNALYSAAREARSAIHFLHNQRGSQEFDSIGLANLDALELGFKRQHRVLIVLCRKLECLLRGECQSVLIKFSNGKGVVVTTSVLD